MDKHFDDIERAREKEAQRAEDLRDIASGKENADKVFRRNAHFVVPGMRIRPDLARRQS